MNDIFYNEYKNSVEENIQYLLMRYPDTKLKEVVSYSLNSNGKRLRPVMVLMFLKALGLNYKLFIDYALALEMVHTYSLVHDDLPSMDNDETRRGVLTTWKKFGEASAILAGDGLLTEAFSVITQGSSLSDKKKIELVQLLSSNAGVDGMVEGQMKDIFGQQGTVDEYFEVFAYKTSTLFVVAAAMARIIADSNQINEFQYFGYYFGILFQMKDDIQDKDGIFEILGEEKITNLYNETLAKLHDTLDKIECEKTELKMLVKMCFGDGE